MHRSSKSLIIIGIVLMLGLVAAACGNDDDSSGSDDTGTSEEATEAPAEEETTEEATEEAPAEEATEEATGGEDAGLAAAQALVDQFTGTPTSFEPSVPLSAPPEQGQSFFWAECAFPVCGSIGDGIEEAAALVGWDLTRVTYDPGNPEEVGAVFQQAIDSGADYIGITGRPLSEFEDGLAQALDAGIPVFDGYTVNPPLQDENGLYSCWGCEPQSDVALRVLADWVCVDSGGEGSVKFSNIPDFPILAFRAEVFEDELTTNCPNVDLEIIDNSIDEAFGGEIPAKMVALAEGWDDGTYLVFSFGDQGFGVLDALDEAGLDGKLKVANHDPNIADLNDLQSGRLAAATTNPLLHVGYMYIDAASRIANDEWDGSLAQALLPFQLLLPGDPDIDLAIANFEATEASSPYVGVPDFREQFAALWGVG